MTQPRVLPLRVVPLPGEGLDSWLEALAHRNGLPLPAMLTILGLPRVATTRLLVTRAKPAALRKVEYRTGLAEGRLDAAVLGDDFPLGPQRQPRCRFCPQCLHEDNGRWLLRWWMPWTFACTTHQVLLHDLCPRCQSAPRLRLPYRSHLHPPGTCLHKTGDQPLCGHDLASTPTLPLPDGNPLLAAQRWIEALLTRHSDAEDHRVVTDLNTCTTWLMRSISTADLHGLGEIMADGWDRNPPMTPSTRLHALSAAVRGILVHTARPILAGTEDQAIDVIRRLRRPHPATASPAPSGMDFLSWHRLSTPARNRFLRAADPEMRPLDRLRLRSATTRAGYPANDSTDSEERARHLPQLLWPGWSVRLIPHEGVAEHYFRAMASALLLLPGESRRTPREITNRLHPYLSDTMGIVLRRSIREHPHVLPALGRLADHLDKHGTSIDYNQRRALIPDEPISYDAWRQLCFTTATQPGERRGTTSQTPRFVQAQRYLHQQLTGSDLADPTHPLAWRSPADRSRYLAFLPTLTRGQRDALHAHARALLAERGIAEPLTWEPPPDCADGLHLPGRPLTDIDLDALERIVLTEQRTITEAARELDTTLIHVRFALEHVAPPPREWTSRHSPLAAWRLRERARSLLTAEFLDREYTQQGKSLTQIAKEADFPRDLVLEHANALGLPIYYSQRPRPIDEDWLREQYLTRKHSTLSIAQQVGTGDETIRCRLQQLGIPLRPQGVHSRTVMTAKLDRSVPRDVRAAVEGTLHGWLRLHRFRITMAFPNLTTAGAYLAAEPNALTTQFQRLEADIGHPLFHRSVQTTPQRPTRRGHSLLRSLEQSHVQELMHDALTPEQLRPFPDAATLAEATTAAAHKAKPGPLKPFDDIAVDRLRIRQETVTLLQDLLARSGQETYGMQIHARTGLGQGTVSDQLRRLHRAGWLTKRTEDDASWRGRAPATRGAGRRRIYYALTPEGHRAAAHELRTRGFPAPRISTDRWDETTDKTLRQPPNVAGQHDHCRQE